MYGGGYPPPSYGAPAGYGAAMPSSYPPPGYGAPPAAGGYGAPPAASGYAGYGAAAPSGYGAYPPQPAAYPPQRSAPPAAPAAGGYAAAPPSGNRLDVTGCTNATVGGIVRGSYSEHTQNHNKPVYKKDEQVNGLDVLIYFWDERDGPNFCGWWFGPKVGGDQVWAYNPDKNARTPPPGGWKVPYDGPVDTTYQVTPRAGGSSAAAPYGYGPPKGADPHAPPGYGPPPGYGAYPPPAHPGYPPAPGYPPYSPYPPGYGVDADARRRASEQQAAAQRAVDDRRRQDDQRYRQDQQRRHDDDQRRRQQDANNREDQRKRQQEDQKKKRESEAKAREDERKRQQDDLRKKREAEIARQKAEIENRKQEEEKRRLESQSALNVRKVIQRVRLASPETMEELKKELETCLAENAGNTGVQESRIKDEATKALEQAQARVDQIAAQRAKEEERRRKEEEERLAAEETTKKLMEEAEELVKSAESEKEKAEAAAKFLESDEHKEMKVEKLQSALKKLEEVTQQTTEACKAATEFITAKRGPMENAKLKLQETRTELVKLQRRVLDAQGRSAQLEGKATIAKEKAVRKAAALKYKSAADKLFKKYDKDNDGKLNKKEVSSFAKQELKFEVPKEGLERIFKRLDPKQDPKQAGVGLEKFAALRTFIGIIKEEIKARQRRAEEEERLLKEKEEAEAKQKLLQTQREELQEKFKGVEEEMVAVEKGILEAIEKGKPINSHAKENGLSHESTLATAEETEGMVEKLREKLNEVKEHLKVMGDDVEPELQGFFKGHLGKFTARTARVDSQLNAVTMAAKAGRERAEKQAYLEIEKHRNDIVASMRKKMNEDGQNIDDLIGAVTKSDVVTLQEFLDFISKCASLDEIDQEMRKKVFEQMDVEGDGKIKKDDFKRAIRIHYKVVKQAVLTDGLGIKTSKTLRRLEINEVIEVYEGPKKEGTVDVERIHGCMLKDGVEGWVTIAGNQGTVFLIPGGNTYNVLKECDLTDDLPVATSKSLKKLKAGDVLEILEFDKKDEEANVTRVKAKVKADGTVGWATVAGEDGTVYLEIA